VPVGSFGFTTWNSEGAVVDGATTVVVTVGIVVVAIGIVVVVAGGM
jgi:hypothetical protein